VTVTDFSHSRSFTSRYYVAPLNRPNRTGPVKGLTWSRQRTVTVTDFSHSRSFTSRYYVAPLNCLAQVEPADLTKLDRRTVTVTDFSHSRSFTSRYYVAPLNRPNCVRSCTINPATDLSYSFSYKFNVSESRITILTS